MLILFWGPVNFFFLQKICLWLHFFVFAKTKTIFWKYKMKVYLSSNYYLRNYVYVSMQYNLRLTSDYYVFWGKLRKYCCELLPGAYIASWSWPNESDMGHRRWCPVDRGLWYIIRPISLLCLWLGLHVLVHHLQIRPNPQCWYRSVNSEYGVLLPLQLQPCSGVLLQDAPIATPHQICRHR